MKNLASILLILLAVTFVSAQSASLRKIDWANFTFQIKDKTVRMKDGLQSGACEEKDSDGIATGDIWNIENGNAAYGDLDGDGREEAILPLVANVCTGNMITDEAILVFTMKNGKPSKLPEFEYFDEGCTAGEKGCNFARNPGVAVSYDKTAKAIVVETFFATGDDAVCCPSLARKTWYKWNGTAFTELKKGRIEQVKREEN